MRPLALALTLATMHPVFGAHLSGMGEHGVVNLHSYASQGKLCWTFELATKGITGASIREIWNEANRLGEVFVGQRWRDSKLRETQSAGDVPGRER